MEAGRLFNPLGRPLKSSLAERGGFTWVTSGLPTIRPESRPVKTTADCKCYGSRRDLIHSALMNPFWIQAEGVRLAITLRPRGGDWLEDDIRLLKRAGVDVIVSALTPAEAEELGLLEESRHCKNSGLEFLSFPIEDRSVPASFEEFDGLLNSVIHRLRRGKTVGVHCRAGIGRSSIIAASVLVRIGLSVDSAFRAVQEARGCAVPDTPEQKQWVQAYTSHFLARF